MWELCCISATVSSAKVCANGAAVKRRLIGAIRHSMHRQGVAIDLN